MVVLLRIFVSYLRLYCVRRKSGHDILILALQTFLQPELHKYRNMVFITCFPKLLPAESITNLQIFHQRIGSHYTHPPLPPLVTHLVPIFCFWNCECTIIRSDRISVHRRNSLSVCVSISRASNVTHFFQGSQTRPDKPKQTQVNPSEPK